MGGLPPENTACYQDDIKHKNALITGARRGIGRATVELFAQRGANIWVCARKKDEAFEVDMAALAEKYGVWIKPIIFDFSDEQAVKTAMGAIFREKLPVDVLVNNAGVIQASQLLQMTAAKTLHMAMQVNFITPVLLMQVVSRIMASRQGGVIINVASVAGLDGAAGYGAYGASKAALINATKTLAAEMAHKNIRAYAIAPSLVETDMMEELSAQAREGTAKDMSMKRFAKPREIAEAILFLASGRTAYQSGQVLRVDGGM